MRVSSVIKPYVCCNCGDKRCRMESDVKEYFPFQCPYGYNAKWREDKED